MEFDFARAIEEVFQSTLSSIASEIAKERAKRLVSEAVAEVAGSTAEAAVARHTGRRCKPCRAEVPNRVKARKRTCTVAVQSITAAQGVRSTPSSTT
jgi:hypothetical protein